MTVERMSNWGRWGADDERGTLNLITDEHVRRAAELVRRGKVYSLAVPLEGRGPIAPGRSPLWHRTTVNQRPEPNWGSADDIVLMHTHGTTHVDALCHVFAEGQMYNGASVSENITPTGGARRNGVQNVGALVRTGWIRVFAEDRALYDSGAPGPNGDVAGWFRKHDLCALGADNVAVEAFPPRTGGALPLHIDVIRNIGGYLIEFLNLEELAADGVYEFLFIAAPLRLMNGIGSPINPLAIC